MSQKLNRYRGIILTTRGIERLENAITLTQEHEKFGSRFTQSELSERAKLSIKTIKKIREGKISTDEASVRALFSAFGLEKLEPADYGQPEPSSSTPNTHPPNSNSSSTPKIDWGEKPDTALFFGRTKELSILNQWVQGDQCRLITLLGMGGIGKTSLAAKLASQVYDRFDYVIWRSLREAPPLDEILVRLIQFLSDQQETEINLPTRLGERIIRLLHYLREHRCLVVLDNLESILQAETAGYYRDGYEGYGELIQRIGSTEHQSCLLLTSRECPRELAPLAGDLTPVRLWSVGSIDTEAGREILKTKGLALDEADDQGQELIRRCSGNPQALHLVATAIQREFLGDVDDFLQEQVTTVEDVRSLLDQHLSRLAPLERSVLFWLAINREPVGLDELMEDLLPPVTKQEVRGALRGLRDRYLIETVDRQFTLQNVVMEFSTDRFVEQVTRELKTQEFNLFHTHALFQAVAKDYIRETQARLILTPLVERIENLQQQVDKSLAVLRSNADLSKGYIAGNLLNLLCQTQPGIHFADFSGLILRQAYLKRITLHDWNLSNTLFIRSSLTQTFSSIYTIAFSPNGKLLATGDGKNNIQLWEVDSQQLLSTLRGHSNEVRTVSFNHDGRFLASGSNDNMIRFWDVQQYKCLYEFLGHTDFISDIKFSPDGTILASSSGDGTIRLWDIFSKKCLYVFSDHSNWVSSLAFSPDGKHLISGSSDNTVRLWDIRKYKCLYVFEGHTNWIRSVAFSPDGKSFLSGSDDSTIRLWNVQNQQCSHVFLGHTDRVRSVAFSSSGQLFASSSDDATVRLWDIGIHQCVHVFAGHTNWVGAISYSPNDQLLASGSNDATIRLWNIQQRRCVHMLSGHTCWVGSIAFNSDGKLLSSSIDSIIRVWNVQENRCISTLIGHDDWVNSVAFNYDNNFLFSGSSDSTIRLWDIHEKHCSHIFSGHSNLVWSIAISPNKKLLASGSSDSTIRLWDIHTRECISILSGHTDWVRSVAFSPDGSSLVSSSDDTTIRLWDIQNGNCLSVLTGHSNWVSCVAFSPQGTLVASCGNDATIRLWDISRQQSIHISIKGHTNWVRSVVFSPDGQLLASCSSDATVRLWNVAKQKWIHVLEGHTNWVESLVFSPDGHTIASGSRDGTIRLWDVKTGECLVIFQVPRPYEGTNITKVRGLTEAQRASLIALGAIDSSLDSKP